MFKKNSTESLGSQEKLERIEALSSVSREKSTIFNKRIKRFLSSDSESIILKDAVESSFRDDVLKKLDKQLIGQDEAKKIVVDAIGDAIESVGKKEGVLNALFFAGNTGVGKTEMARVLSEICFGTRDGVTVIPCEQYTEGHTSRNLFGSPKSYVGFGESTPLSDINLFRPYRAAKSTKMLHESLKGLDDFAILLFDEIEKAHPKVKQTLLGILSSGIHEFPTGKEENEKDCKFSKFTNFQNVIIIFTSNAGTSDIQQSSRIGFGSDTDTEAKKENNKSILKAALKSEFSPELINRIDNFVFFHNIEMSHCVEIVKKEINQLNKLYTTQLQGRIRVEVGEALINEIVRLGFDETSGARNLKRVFDKIIKRRINNYITAGGVFGSLPLGKKALFMIDLVDGEIVVELIKKDFIMEAKDKVAKVIGHLFQEKQLALPDAIPQFPMVAPIRAELSFLEDRYRRAHRLACEGVEIDDLLHFYEDMLRGLGCTEEDIDYQQKLAEHGIIDPEDVQYTYAHACKFPVIGQFYYNTEDMVIDRIADSAINNCEGMTESELKEAVFRNVTFFMGHKLDFNQKKLLYAMIGDKTKGRRFKKK